MIVADGPLNVYSDYPSSGMPNKANIITTLVQNETADVISKNYSK
jgi:hypothetical protein